MRRRALVGALTCAAALAVVVPAGAAPACPQPDWPTYGRSAAHTFAVPDGCSPIGTDSVPTLVPAWHFRAPDSISAQPVVAGGTLYVGSWDGTFYALDAATGAVRWTYVIDDTHEVAFGRIVSTATVVDVPDARGRPVRLVVFGGGATVYVLDAATGRKLASRDLDPRTPALRAAMTKAGNEPQVEIESSPAVVALPRTSPRERRVIVGMDVHNNDQIGRTGVVALRLFAAGATWRLDPVWKFDPETSRTYPGAAGLTEGSGRGFGCGGVWSSPAVDPAADLVVFGSASCSHPEDARKAGENYAEAMWGVRASTGKLVWRYRPADERSGEDQVADAHLDDDFGASAALFRLQSGQRVAGEGRKSAGYYVRDAATGRVVSHADAGSPGHLQEDFSLGGFLGTPAVQLDPAGRALRVIGGTAIPTVLPNEISAGQVDRATWAVRAIDPATGEIEWTYRLAGPTYGSTSVVGGVAFVPDTVGSALLALDAETGLPLWAGAVPGPPSSTAVVVGDTVFLGLGTRQTDGEFKAFGSQLQEALSVLGPHPLSPLSGVIAFRLAG